MKRPCIRCGIEKTDSKFYPDKDFCFDCYEPLSVDAVKDFQTCALLYKYRHIDKSPESLYSREMLQDRYENTMKKIAAFFFYKRQGGITPSFAALINRWERHWFPKDMSAYDIAVEQHSITNGSLVKYNTEATAALLRFYEVFSEMDWDPLLIHEPFLIPAGATKLQGAFDLVLRSGSDEYRVVKWTLTSWRSSLSNLRLDFAMLKHAFEFRNETPKPNTSYVYYDLSSPRASLTPYSVDNADVNALLYWTQEAFEADFFAPRRGLTYYCKRCPFDKPCSEFKITKDVLVERLGGKELV